MISLMVFCPNQADATSFYRGLGPLSKLKRQIRDLNLAFVTDVNWATLRMADVVFFQRPYTAAHLKIIKMAKRLHRPVWVDYDDDLFRVPLDNPAHALYSDPEIQKSVAQSIAEADIVTVSTEHLRQKLLPLNKEIRVVPNALDPEILSPRRIRKDRPKLIMWRGSQTHMRDVYDYRDQIALAAKAHPDWTWHFIGMTPWFLDGLIPDNRFMISPGLDVMEYFEFIQKVQAPVQIVPLANNSFNQSKSNIAWIEGSYAGSACVVPDWDEWKKPGAYRYEPDAPDAFFDAVHEAIKSSEKSLDPGAESWKHIQGNLLLENVNVLRKKVLSDLLGIGGLE